MGIFIRLHVAHNVSQEEWEPVYEESLALAEKFKLIDFDVAVKFGEELFYGIPVKERELDGEHFWQSIGDSETMGCAEEQRLLRKLPQSRVRKTIYKSYDPLMSVARSCTMLHWEDERCQNSYEFWGNKTQGELYHLFLLAIGCMIESRLAGKACVSGDITLGQCQKAVALANKMLKEQIGTPVRCDLETLYQRICTLPLEKEEQLNVFQGLYMGVLDKNYGEFVKAHFHKHEIAEYWRREFENCKIGTYGFSTELKVYFNLGNGLNELCKIVRYEDEKGKRYYEQFIKAIMDTNLFLEKKDLRDCLEIQRTEEAPYTIDILMAQFAFSSATNHSVDAYMPIKQIEEILLAHIGEYCDVPGIINEYLNQKEGEKEKNTSEKLNDFIESFGTTMRQKMKTCDIYKIRDLLYYETGDKIEPKLETTCIDYLKFYKETCLEESFDKLMGESLENKCAFLIQQNSNLFLMQNQWQKIFEEIEESKECFRRYYPMVRVQTYDKVKWLVYAYITNDDFYNYCEHISTNQSLI